MPIISIDWGADLTPDANERIVVSASGHKILPPVGQQFGIPISRIDYFLPIGIPMQIILFSHLHPNGILFRGHTHPSAINGNISTNHSVSGNLAVVLYYKPELGLWFPEQ